MKLLHRVDLAALLAAGAKPPQPQIWARTDGRCLLYEGLITGLWGRPESGKSMLGQAVAAQFVKAGGAVFYIDFEQGPYVAAARFGQLGLDPTDLGAVYYYDGLDDSTISELFEEIDAVLGTDTPVLFLLDSVDTLLAALGISPNDQEAGTKINDKIFNPLRSRNVTGLVIDHVSTSNTPAKDRGPMGSTHKLSEVDAGIQADMVTMPVPGGKGHVRLILDKDRHGGVRQHSANPPGQKLWVAGEAFISSEADPDRIEVWVDPPNASYAPKTLPHWQIVLQALSVADHTKEELERVIEAETGMKPNGETVRNALKELKRKIPDPYKWTGMAYTLTASGRELAAEVLSPTVAAADSPDGEDLESYE